MKQVLIAVGAVVIAGIVIVIWLVSASATNAPAGTSGRGASSSQSDGASASPAPTHGPVPNATPATPTTGSEVLPPPASPNPQLPPAPLAEPLIPGPYPPSSSANGELVDGFPVEVVGPMPDSDVLKSAITTEGSVMQTSLLARTDASQDDVRAHYTNLWTSKGLQVGAPGADGSLSSTGPHESITLAFQSAGTGTLYAVFGVFRVS